MHKTFQICNEVRSLKKLHIASTKTLNKVKDRSTSVQNLKNLRRRTHCSKQTLKLTSVALMVRLNFQHIKSVGVISHSSIFTKIKILRLQYLRKIPWLKRPSVLYISTFITLNIRNLHFFSQRLWGKASAYLESCWVLKMG